jgi:hypothetical protein
MWAGLFNALPSLLSALKNVFAFIFVRRATKIEVERDVLKQKSDTQEKQLEIASRPLDSADDVRQRMRDGEL